MKKLSLLSLKESCDELSKELCWLSALETVKPDEDKLTKLYGSSISVLQTDSDVQKLEKKKQDLIYALECVGKYREKKKILDFTKKSMTRSDFEALDSSLYDTFNKVDSILDISKKLTEYKAKVNQLNNRIASFKPWEDYTLPLSEKVTKTCSIELFTLPSQFPSETVISELEQKNCYAVLVSTQNELSYYTGIYLNDNDDIFRSTLSFFGYMRPSFGDAVMTAKDEIKSCINEINQIEAASLQLDSEYRALAKYADEFEYAVDYINSKLSVLSLRSDMITTDSSVFITGFVCEKDIGKLEKLLSKFLCYYEITDPESDDSVPVMLQNSVLATPFEAILGMYSYPDYNGYDPTAVMGLFYFVIFGFMFADFIYGVLLSVGCFILNKLMKPKGTSKKMLLSFAISGISSAIAGILFGAYMGDLPSVFKESILLSPGKLNTALWFDPLNDPLKLLIVSIAIGALHLLTGLIIKFYMLCKRGQVFDAICDVGSWLVLFIGFGVYAAGAAASGTALPQIGKYVVISGMLMLVLTQGRAEKNIFLKFGKGLLSLYNIVSYASDLLSYSRILALSLASAVIASVVNIMATLAGPSVIGIIMMLLIIPVGHALNIALNLLGTFVHTSRLQYIEFFGKFYEDGGREFSPYSIDTKYIEIINE